MKKVAHYKVSPCAYAPDAIVACINKHSTEYEAILLNATIDEYKGDFSEFDVVHFHNKYKATNHPKQCIQYHSPPYHPSYVDFSYSHKRLVVAQFQCLLGEYAGCQKVRNIIDINQPVYEYKKIDKIKIGFAPTCKVAAEGGNYEAKGYYNTPPVLEKLKQNYGIEYDVIIDVSLEECLQRKSECSIIIDECVTNSYHRNALEGLAMGKLTICSMDADIERVFKEVSGSPIIPIENIWIEGLYAFLENLCKSGYNLIHENGIRNYHWFRKYWRPEDIVKEYTKIYDNL